MGESKDGIVKMGGCLCGVFWLLLIILLPMSYSTLEYYQMGFAHRRTTGTVDRSHVYSAGKYMLGPDYGFTVFPASVQNVDITDVAAWTESDVSTNAGTSVEMDLSYQYQLIPEELPQLFDKRNTVFRPFIENLAMAAIKDTATNFSADAFLMNRMEIEKEMKRRIGMALTAAHATVKGFMMRRVTFPATFSNRKLDAATQQLKNSAENYRKQSEVTRTETTKQVKIKSNEAVKVSEQALAESELIKEKAKVSAVDLEQTTRNAGLKTVRDALGLVLQKEFVSLDYLINIADQPAGTKTFIDFSTVLASDKP